MALRKLFTLHLTALALKDNTSLMQPNVKQVIYAYKLTIL